MTPAPKKPIMCATCGFPIFQGMADKSNDNFHAICSMPGVPLDVLIHEKVMGNTRVTDPKELSRLDLYVRPGDVVETWFHHESGIGTGIARCYSTDIEAAWMVVEKMETRWAVSIGSNHPGWWCSIMEHGTCADLAHEIGDNAPHAICLAALKATGGPR